MKENDELKNKIRDLKHDIKEWEQENDTLDNKNKSLRDQMKMSEMRIKDLHDQLLGQNSNAMDKYN